MHEKLRSKESLITRAKNRISALLGRASLGQEVEEPIEYPGELVDEPAYEKIQMPPLTDEQETALYVTYRQTGGKPFEPQETKMLEAADRYFADKGLGLGRIPSDQV